MSALDGFYATWSKARDTFGEGTPQTGEQFDGSPQLSQAQSALDQAAPGSQWTGAGANAYGAANTRHQEVIGGIGALDKRLAAQVTYSAEVVAHGRTQLDDVRKWVTDAAASVPPGKDQDQKLLPIANKGIGEVVGIVQKTNSELGNVGGKIRALSAEYDRLGLKAFVPKEGPSDDVQGVKGEEEKKKEDDAKKRAEQDVQDALAGNQEAAGRVDDVLSSIKPGQELTAEQGSYLSQMQAQQKGMTVEQLKTAEQRLGDHKDIIGNSMQLMSNDKVKFPKTELKVDALDDPSQTMQGGFDKLPDSVQQAVKSSGVLYADQMRDISGIVRDGDSQFQTGTELDKEMLSKADRMMDAPIWDKDPASSGQDVGRDPFLDPTVSEIFTSAGRDHPAVAELITGERGEDFLHDITHHYWADNGAAAGSLLSWTGQEAVGPNHEIAASTAHAYADYIGRKDGELLTLNNRTLGDINPNLVQGMAEGLTPYIPNIAGTSEGQLPGFGTEGTLDTDTNVQNGLMPEAKGVFSVLSSDEKASVLFNGAAQHEAVLAQERFAEDFKHHDPELSSHSEHLTDSATLQGLVDAGLHNSLAHEKLDGIELEKAVYQAKSDAFDMDKSVIGSLGGKLPVVGEVVGPGLDVFGPGIKDAIVGPPPTAAATDNNGNYIAPDLATSAADAQVISALANQGVNVPGVPSTWLVHEADGGVRVMSFAEAHAVDENLHYGQYTQRLADAAQATMGDTFAESVNRTIAERYNQVSEVLDPQTDQPKQPK